MGTVADNIRYGKQDATEEEVIAATEENMIFKLPRQLTD